MMPSKIREHLATALPHTSYEMTEAVVDVIYGNFTWREAAARRKVTESGILRAMQRSKVREHIAESRKPA